MSHFRDFEHHFQVSVGDRAAVYWLVVTGTMEFYDFPYIRNVIIPTDELIFFRGVESTNQYILGDVQLDIYPLVNKHSY